MISSTNTNFFFLVRVFPMHVDIIVNNLSLYKFPNWFGTIQNTNHIGSCNLKFDQLITRYTHTCPHSEKPHASQLENSPRSLQPEWALGSNEDPAQPNIKSIFFKNLLYIETIRTGVPHPCPARLLECQLQFLPSPQPLYLINHQVVLMLPL